MAHHKWICLKTQKKAYENCMLYYKYHLRKNCMKLREAVVQFHYLKKIFLKGSQNLQENICVEVSYLINFVKKETPAQAFSWGLFEISKKTFFKRATKS